MTLPAALRRAVLIGLLFTAASTPAWNGVAIRRDRQTGAFEVVMENRLIRLVYKRHYPATAELLEIMNQGRSIKVTDRIREFRLKQGDVLLSDNLDGRHTASEDKAIYLLQQAELIRDNEEAKTVRLTFCDSSQIEHLTLFRDLPVLKIEYDRGGHCLHYGIRGGEYVIFGSKEWQRRNNWSVEYPTLRDTLTEHHSYYRESWGPAGPLDCKGCIVAGTFNQKRECGIGVILPHTGMRFLKLQPDGGGFEILMERGYTCYIYPALGQSEKLITEGVKWVDKIRAGEL